MLIAYDFQVLGVMNRVSFYCFPPFRIQIHEFIQDPNSILNYVVYLLLLHRQLCDYNEIELFSLIC